MDLIGPDPYSGERATRPGEGAFQRPPLVELDGGAFSFAGDTKDCYQYVSREFAARSCEQGNNEHLNTSVERFRLFGDLGRGDPSIARVNVSNPSRAQQKIYKNLEKVLTLFLGTSTQSS